MAKSLYLTTTLPYVNADPHLGFALEIVQADVLARYHRALGRDVFFSTGTDEHGQKIFEAATKNGEEVQTYVDHYAARFQELKTALDLSNDVFIRTTDPAHEKAATALWRLCAQAGDIYKKAYEGPYCVGCERFLSARDLLDGKCVIHQTAPTIIKEENYFFRFAKYAPQLLEYLAKENSIVPNWRREEAIRFVEAGLEDFSISREKARLAWGLPVPGDNGQVMYVWFDALANYISTLGWPEDAAGQFQKFWLEGETLQLAGKDQVRFQSLMWQAILFSSGIKNTDRVFYHGFITSGGQKMSKSLGNVINPFDLVRDYGTDAVRYFLLRHVHPVEDSDVTLEKFKEAYNANLANGLGNLVSRVMKMAVSNNIQIFDKDQPPRGQNASSLENYEFNKAMDNIWSLIGQADGQIQIIKPFELIKTDRHRAEVEIKNLLLALRTIASQLEPFMPQTAEKIKQAIATNKMPEALFPRKE